MAFAISATSCEKHLICSVCMELFADPRALPCMHTFCQNCLQSYITSMHSKKDIKFFGFECPVCRQITKAPIEGLEVHEWACNFTPNYAVKGLLEEHEEALAMQDNSTGGSDEQCNDKEDVQFCDMHPDKIAEFKCEDHSPVRTCCAVCAARKHKRCDTLLYLGDDSSSENGDDVDINMNIDPELPAVKRRTLSRLARIKLREDQTESLGCEDENELEHKSSHRRLKRLIETPRSYSFEECEDLRILSASSPPNDLINSVKRNDLEVDEDLRNITTTMASDMSQSPGSVEGAAADKDTDQHESHPSLRRLVRGAAPHTFEEDEAMRRLSAKTNKAVSTDGSYISHSEEVTAAGMNISRSRSPSALCKEMSVITEIPEEDAAFSEHGAPNYPDAVLSVKSTLNIPQEVQVKLASDSQMCSVTGICSMPDGKVLIADSNNCKVKLFDVGGGSKAYLSLPSDPWDVDSIGECEAVVSLPNAMCLFTLIIDNTVEAGRRIDVDKKCYGVVFSNMEFIVACGSDVRIYSYNGEFIVRILKDKKSFIPNPRSIGSNFKYLCVDPEDCNRMFISDQNRGVLCTSRNGEVRSSCASSEKGCPLGLTTDRHGTLLVCQTPNYLTICIVCDQGCRTKDVLCVDKVQTVDLNKLDQRLWVSQSDSDTLYVYTVQK